MSFIFGEVVAFRDDFIKFVTTFKTFNRSKQMKLLVRLNDRIGEIEFVQAEAHRELIALPPPSEQVPDETPNMKVRRVVNAYCRANGLNHDTVWNNLYTQFNYRYRRRVEKKGRETKLQAFVRLGLVDQLYDLAIELLGNNSK